MSICEQTAGETAEKNMTITDLRWPVLLPIGICVVLIAWLYMPIFKGWYRLWMAEESYYSHGILVPFISAFIVWLKRKQLAQVAIRPYALGYLFVVPLVIFIVVTLWAGAIVPAGLGFPILLGGIVLILFGRSMTRELVFPIGYLFFMCVLPGFVLSLLSFKIQMMSTVGGTLILQALTFDAYRQGAAISLPNIEVLVGSPCSGFRLLISLFAFAVLFAYLKEGPWWGKAILVAVTLPLSLVVNSIRIALIAIVGEYMGSSAMHTFHDYSGYLVLVLAFVALFFLARLVKCEKFNSILLSS